MIGMRKAFQAPSSSGRSVLEHQFKAPFEDIPHFHVNGRPPVEHLEEERGASREKMAATRKTLLEALAGGRERSAKLHESRDSKAAARLSERGERLFQSRMREKEKEEAMSSGESSLLRLSSSKPAELVVDACGSGSFLDVASAVACARDGDVVLVLPGSYKGPIRVKKSLRLIGKPDMQKGSVILEHIGRDSLFEATGSSTEVKLEHLMLRHKGSKEEHFDHAALEVEAGASVVATGCGLTCPDANGATVRGEGSRLTVRQSQVCEAGRCGIEVLQGATLVAEQCQVTRNGWSGVEVAMEATASVSRCTVAKNGMFGIHFKHGSRGKVERNVVSGHGAAFGGTKVEPGARVESGGGHL